MLNNRVVLVTGACGGIGAESCRQFVAAGARLFITDIDADAVSALQQKLGGDVAGLAADLTDPAQVDAVFAAVEQRYGRLDAAFNNAGRGSGEVALADMPLSEWSTVLAINLTGTFLCMQHEARLLKQGGGGAIVNTSSILGLHAGLNPAYTASKHGLCGLTKSAALSLAPDHIRVNAICPGLIEAGMGLKVLSRDEVKVANYIASHPLGRPGSAAEVAQAALWLLSDAASYVTGHMLPIDGGYSAV